MASYNFTNPSTGKPPPGLGPTGAPLPGNTIDPATGQYRLSPSETKNPYGPATTTGNVGSTVYNPTGGGEGILSGPGYGEDWYKAHGGDLSGPSNTETLFKEGMAGTDPYYQYAQTQVDNSINNAAAARGNWNSSSTMNTLATANADLRGQQAMGMANLAGAADTSALGRYEASSGAATQAQKDLENRVITTVNGTEKLSDDQAKLVEGFYQLAQTGQLTADMAAIEAQMKAAGMDAAEIQALMSNMMQISGHGASIASSYLGSSGSGGGGGSGDSSGGGGSAALAMV